MHRILQNNMAHKFINFGFNLDLNLKINFHLEIKLADCRGEF